MTAWNRNPAVVQTTTNSHMFTKTEIIEIMYRPQPMDEKTLNALIRIWSDESFEKLSQTFKRETNGKLIPAGQNKFLIQY